MSAEYILSEGNYDVILCERGVRTFSDFSRNTLDLAIVPAVKKVPLDKVPRLTMVMASLTRQNFDPQEGFVLSRVNGMWDVGSILKLCPMNESDVLLIFARLLERKVIELD
ncbi:MAG TPA: hypothetical protein VFS78_17645, partial [Vicinamibacteria bacterium]|nr:hypothetical protein [Vicinamibacteria bacterium]